MLKAFKIPGAVWKYCRETGRIVPPDIILSNRGSFGDAILMTALLCELHKRGKNVAILTDHPELYQGLPFGAGCIPASTPVITASRLMDISVHSIKYAEAIVGEHAEIPPKQHILAEMCAHAGLKGEMFLRPYYFVSEEERAIAHPYHGSIVVQSSCLQAKFKMWTKEWGAKRFQKVVDHLVKKHRIVQLGAKEDPLLQGAEDCRGLPFRKAAAILSQAKLFIGLVGFLMHLARAVDTRSVIVYGGRERPWQSGYSCNKNIISETPCSPCWRYDDCPGHRVCMDMIQETAVTEAAEATLKTLGEPMPVDKVVLQRCSF